MVLLIVLSYPVTHRWCAINRKSMNRSSSRFPVRNHISSSLPQPLVLLLLVLLQLKEANTAPSISLALCLSRTLCFHIAISLALALALSLSLSLSLSLYLASSLSHASIPGNTPSTRDIINLAKLVSTNAASSMLSSSTVFLSAPRSLLPTLKGQTSVNAFSQVNYVAGCWLFRMKKCLIM